MNEKEKALQEKIASIIYEKMEKFCTENKRQSLNIGAFGEVSHRAAEEIIKQLKQ